MFILIGAAVAVANGCTGDQFRQAPGAPEGGSGGSAGSAGAAGKATAGAGGAQAGASGAGVGGTGVGGAGAGAGGTSAGAAGTTAAGAAGTTAGSAGASSAGAGGAAGFGAAGTGGKAGAGGTAGKGGSGGAAGQGGASGAGGSAGAAGSPVVEVAPTIASLTLYASGCSGDAYVDGAGVIEVPQGAGKRCLAVAGDVKAGDVIVVGGQQLVPTTYDDASKSIRAEWDVPHGGGLTPAAAEVTVARGALISSGKPVPIVPRQLDSSKQGSAGGLGNKSRPYSTLSSAVAGAAAGDWIVVTKLDEVEASPAAIVVPPGVTVAAATEQSVAVEARAALELQAGATLARLKISCATVTGGACLRAAGKGISLQGVSVGGAEVGCVHLAAATEVDVAGGVYAGKSPFVADQTGAMLRLDGAEVKAVGSAAAITMTGPGDGTQVLEIVSTQDVKRIEGEQWVVFDGGKSVSITGLAGKSSGTSNDKGVIDIRGPAASAALSRLSVSMTSGVGVRFDGQTLVLDDARVEVTSGSGFVLLGGTTTIKDATVNGPTEVGFGLRSAASAKLLVPGSLAISQAAGASGTAMAAGGETTVTGSVYIVDAPKVALDVLNGGVFTSTPTGAGEGVVISNALAQALHVSAGARVKLTGGSITQQSVFTDLYDALISINAGGAKTEVSVIGTQLAFNGASFPVPAGAIHQPPSGKMFLQEGVKEHVVLGPTGNKRYDWRTLADAQSVGAGSFLLFQY